MINWTKLVNKGSENESQEGFFAPKRVQMLNSIVLIAACICGALAINAFLGQRPVNAAIQLGRIGLLITAYVVSSKRKHQFAFLICLFGLISGNFAFLFLQEYNIGNSASYFIFLVLIYYFIENRKHILGYYLFVALIGMLNFYFEYHMLSMKINTYLVSYVSIVLVLFFLLKLFYEENQSYQQKVLEREEELKSLNEELQVAVEHAEANSAQLALANSKIISMQSQVVASEKTVSLTSLSQGILENVSNPLNFLSGGIGALEVSQEELLELIQDYRSLKHCEESDRSKKIAEIHTKEEELDIDELLEDLPNLFQDVHLGMDKLKALMNTLAVFGNPLSSSDFLPIDVVTFIQDLTQQLSPTEQTRMHIDVSHKLQEVNLAPKIFHLALTEIIKNALEYTTGKVHINAWGMGKNWALSIQDFGKGISEEIQAKMLEPFYTTDPDHEHKGLGLTLASHIIVQHQGNLEIKSTKEKGTTIYITLPVKVKKQE